MTDEEQNLTPAQPVAPRRRLPPNPQMAQPMRGPQPGLPPVPPPVPQQQNVGLESIPAPEIDVAPQVDPASPPPPVGERVAEPQQVPVPVLPDEPTPSPVAAESSPPAVTTMVPAFAVEPVRPAPPVVAPTPATPVAAAPPAQAAPPVAAALETPAVVAAPVATPAAPPTPAAAATPDFDFPRTMRDTLQRVDQTWAVFRAIALRFPSERMDERIGGEGWTVKQMLEHVAAWHDLTADRLVKFINSGAPAPLDRDTDRFNAAVARQAIGKTSGEVVRDMDATFNRLRRQMARLTDDQLEANDWWVAWVIGGNTYGHYEEHWAEIYTPDLPPGGRNRR